MVKSDKAAEAPQTATENKAQPAAGGGGAPKGDRQWWFDARGLDDTSLLNAVYQSGCSAIVINPDQQERVMTAKPRVVWVDRPEQLDQLMPDVWVLSADEGLLAKARQAGRKAGCFMEVADLDREFPRCRDVVKRGYDFVIIDMHHATYIPFELLIAEAPGHTRLLRLVPIKGLVGTVDDSNQALNAFRTLELGVDVLFRTRSAKDVKQLDSDISERLRGKVSLVPAEVVEVEHTELGHRVCVDTSTLMTPEEGMIVGSTGWGGLFVCSETHYLPHMNLREFRVNAGAVHSYVWGPNNVAVYLSELRGGSRVLAVDVHGRTRVLTVGRAKIERRPLLLLVARVLRKDIPDEHFKRLGADPKEVPEEIHIQTMVQNDWHVRLMGADHKVRNSTLVKKGEMMLAYVDLPGRHTGIKVPETIVEK